MVTYKELLIKVVTKLSANKIDYYLTGSMAVELYAGRHIVSDIDIVVKREDIKSLKRLFFIKEITRKNKFGRFRSLKYSRNRIEFAFFDNITRDGRTFSFAVNDQRLRDCRKVGLGGISINVISPEELIILKLVLDRNTKEKHDRKDALSVYQKGNINLVKLFVKAVQYKVLRKCIDLVC